MSAGPPPGSEAGHLTTGHAEHRLATGPPEAQSLQVHAWSRGPGGWPQSSPSDARASVGHSPRGVAPLCVSTGSERPKSKRLTTPNRTEPPSLQGAHRALGDFSEDDDRKAVSRPLSVQQEPGEDELLLLRAWSLDQPLRLHRRACREHGAGHPCRPAEPEPAGAQR